MSTADQVMTLTLRCRQASKLSAVVPYEGVGMSLAGGGGGKGAPGCSTHLRTACSRFTVSGSSSASCIRSANSSAVFLPTKSTISSRPMIARATLAMASSESWMAGAVPLLLLDDGSPPPAPEDLLEGADGGGLLKKGGPVPENPAWPNPLKLVIPGRPAPVSALPLVEASPCPRGSALLLVLLPNDVEPGPRKVAMPGLPLPR
mmetsp:Transcript_17472/g.48559  ORF Transcript_17472/g.48559 Transcript_17472/m.48559 type:complete len:204 (+) Transcript_17472:349-960(+)